MKASSHAFVQNYRKDTKYLQCLLKRRGLTQEDSEDLAQEAFLRCYKTLLEQPDMEHTRLLATVARNLHIDQYRRQGRRKFVAVDEEQQRLAADSEKETALMQRILMEQLVAAIPEKRESKFFRMHYQDGLKLQEIADQTDHSIGTVASQVFRYRQKFQVLAQRAFEAANAI